MRLSLARFAALAGWVSTRTRIGTASVALALLAFARASFAAQEPLPPARAGEKLVEIPARLVGTLLLPDERGAKNVEVELNGWSMLPARSNPGVPYTPWKSPSVRTDADGRFELEFVPPRAYQFSLALRVDGCVPLSWRWTGVNGGDRLDLGRVIFERGGSVHGRLVDSEGRAVRERWTVFGDSRRQMPGAQSMRNGEIAMGASQSATNPLTGEFTLEDLPPGPIGVRAMSRLGVSLDGTLVDVAPGEVSETTLVWNGPDLSQRIGVQIQTPPFYGLASEAGPVRLLPQQPAPENARDPSTQPVDRPNEIEVPREGKREPRQPQTVVFDGLSGSDYTLEISDPRFLPWRQEHIEPGQLVDARLIGAAEVRLRVLDARTHLPILRYGLRTRLSEPRSAAGVHEILPVGGEAPLDGAFGGLLPVDQLLLVSADGYCDAEIELSAPKIGTPSELTLELRRGRTLRGRVLEADGVTPAPNLAIELREGAGANGWSPWPPPGARTTKSGADGRFELTGLRTGGYIVEASRSLLVVVRADVKAEAQQPGQLDEALEVTLTLPRTRELSGRVFVGEALDFSRAVLFFTPTSRNDELRARYHQLVSARDTLEGCLIKDGLYRSPALPLGPCAIELVAYPDPAAPSQGVAPLRLSLGSVDVMDDDTAHDLDAGANAPAGARVDVLVDGVPIEGLTVALHRAGSNAPSGDARTGADGVAYVGPLAAGPVHVVVEAADRRWSWCTSEPLALEAGQVATANLSISLVEAELQLLENHEGKPLAKRALSIAPVVSPVPLAPRTLRTDAQGRVRLALVPGEYRIEEALGFDAQGRPRAPVSAGVTIDWTNAGPEPASVVMEAR